MNARYHLNAEQPLGKSPLLEVRLPRIIPIIRNLWERHSITGA